MIQKKIRLGGYFIGTCYDGKEWKVEQLSTRIIEDVKALPRVLNVIIAAEGCVVKNVFPRTGRSSRRSDDKGDLMRKPRNRQSIAILKAHPLYPYHRNIASFFQCEETHFSLRIPPRQ